MAIATAPAVTSRSNAKIVFSQCSSRLESCQFTTRTRESSIQARPSHSTLPSASDLWLCMASWEA